MEHQGTGNQGGQQGKQGKPAEQARQDQQFDDGRKDQQPPVQLEGEEETKQAQHGQAQPAQRQHGQPGGEHGAQKR